MLFIPKAGESCWILGKGRNILRELLEGEGTGSSVTSGLRHAEEPCTEGHQRDPRTCSKSSSLEDVGVALQRLPGTHGILVWDCTWIGLRSHQNLINQLHWFLSSPPQ